MKNAIKVAGSRYENIQLHQTLVDSAKPCLQWVTNKLVDSGFAGSRESVDFLQEMYGQSFTTRRFEFINQKSFAATIGLVYGMPPKIMLPRWYHRLWAPSTPLVLSGLCSPGSDALSEHDRLRFFEKELGERIDVIGTLDTAEVPNCQDSRIEIESVCSRYLGRTKSFWIMIDPSFFNIHFSPILEAIISIEKNLPMIVCDD